MSLADELRRLKKSRPELAETLRDVAREGYTSYTFYARKLREDEVKWLRGQGLEVEYSHVDEFDCYVEVTVSW